MADPTDPDLPPERRAEILERRVLVLSRALENERARRAAAEERLRHIASHDPLTGLPNRALFMDRLGMAVQHARRHSLKVAVLVVDLDDFRSVNETHGHDAGDALLGAVAAVLGQAVRKTDSVARLGNDEFALVLTELGGPVDAGLVASKIIDRFHEPFDADGTALEVGASVGIALYPDHGEEPEGLLTAALRAMDQVKGGGRNAYRMYGESAA